MQFPSVVKKQTVLLLAFVFTLISIFVGLPTAKASNSPMVDVANIGSLGETAKVPVTLRNVTTITSGQFQVTLPSNANGRVTFERFEALPPFRGQDFQTMSNVNGNTLTVDFVSTTGSQQRIARDGAVIGYIHLKLSNTLSKGEIVNLTLSNVVAKGNRNADITVTANSGQLIRKMPPGDVVGHNETNAAAAVRIFQHLEGRNTITNPEQISSADVDGDGSITQADAQAILDYLVGKTDTFLAVKQAELGIAPVGGEYFEQLEAKNGKGPYNWAARGLPAGLALNADTGVISGKATRASDSNVTITVTDRSGNTATRQLKIEAKESNIQSIATIPAIAVKIGQAPQLPTSVEVTYKDGRKENVAVTWNTVDVFTPGVKTARGRVGNTGMTVTVAVTVSADGQPIATDGNGQPLNPGQTGGEPIRKVTSKFVGMLNVHTIIVESSADVYGIDVLAKVPDNRGRLVDTKIPMHFEGSNEFSLATPRLNSGDTVTIIAYDRVGKEIKRTPHKLQ